MRRAGRGPFHLFRCLDAEAFRFNNRETTDGARFRLLASRVTGERLTYEALPGSDVPAGGVVARVEYRSCAAGYGTSPGRRTGYGVEAAA